MPTEKSALDKQCQVDLKSLKVCLFVALDTVYHMTVVFLPQENADSEKYQLEQKRDSFKVRKDKTITVEPLNKGHFGAKICLVERLSLSRR